MLKRFVAVVAALDRLALLVIGEFKFRSHFYALRLRDGASGGGGRGLSRRLDGMDPRARRSNGRSRR
jgi:hypothetical protein